MVFFVLKLLCFDLQCKLIFQNFVTFDKKYPMKLHRCNFSMKEGEHFLLFDEETDTTGLVRTRALFFHIKKEMKR